ncbi:dethiobiotin synthase [Pantoea allii]|uniref:ATP-dependent dethiobiotin synthetase BioD n=1 Tax=Pantoea allii TaxID=574096 RepID=A0A2V2BP02_9GAMM|nr:MULTISPECIES: dethiobiotin synthase [Pantoea]MBW1212377.1 dethiobiotin synthase [Pantoea allii]MBW1252984.1 dethiobiotin synthase [Pantoea allii]MBW1255985.1 dethiobiotin synthase [Pantoea allii]MBW1262238.1 dethiobiotin synthase [Pantoea allii]MBW1265062.1 dethiobiotin synthase [Pantoea allii]
MKTLFITGTDTEVGKTVVSRALLQSFSQANERAAGYKPVARCGVRTEEGLRNKDGLFLQNASSLALPYHAVNPVIFEKEEICGYPPEKVDYAQITQGLQHLNQLVDRVVVEGTGGWRSLMNDTQPLSTWVVEQQLPVILVVGIKLGCISHALLTAEAILADGLPLVGWVANRINPGLAHYADIIAVLREQISAPLLGELPYLPRAEQRDLSPYLDISRLNADNLHFARAKIA